MSCFLSLLFVVVGSKHTSPKHLMIHTVLGGLYTQYEPDYWWFELVHLFNKTLMCGGLVMLAPGSSYQILSAGTFCSCIAVVSTIYIFLLLVNLTYIMLILSFFSTFFLYEHTMTTVLFMLFHLLMVLKLAPYVKSSEDISCIICTMTLMLTSLGAYAMKMRSSSTQIKLIGTFLVVLTLMTVTACILITIIVDCGLLDRCCNKKKYERMKREMKREERAGKSTQVQPLNIDPELLQMFQPTEEEQNQEQQQEEEESEEEEDVVVVEEPKKVEIQIKPPSEPTPPPQQDNVPQIKKSQKPPTPPPPVLPPQDEEPQITERKKIPTPPPPPPPPTVVPPPQEDGPPPQSIKFELTDMQKKIHKEHKMKRSKSYRRRTKSIKKTSESGDSKVQDAAE